MAIACTVRTIKASANAFLANPLRMKTTTMRRKVGGENEEASTKRRNEERGAERAGSGEG
jgi:hypothetical protein